METDDSTNDDDNDGDGAMKHKISWAENNFQQLS